MNVERKPGYNQVCVWPGTLVPEDQVPEFEKHFADAGARVQFLETVMTGPDTPLDPETGGRADVFFAVHGEDVPGFAVPRLIAGIRWIEDVLAPGNYEHEIYPERVRGYCRQAEVEQLS